MESHNSLVTADVKIEIDVAEEYETCKQKNVPLYQPQKTVLRPPPTPTLDHPIMPALSNASRNCKLCYSRMKKERKTHVTCGTCQQHYCFTSQRNCLVEAHQYEKEEAEKPPAYSETDGHHWDFPATGEDTVNMAGKDTVNTTGKYTDSITGKDTVNTTGKDTDNTAGVERDDPVPTPTSQTGARYQGLAWCPADLGTSKESGVNLEPDIKLESISVPSVHSYMDCDTKHDMKLESSYVPSVYCDMDYDTEHDIKLDSNSVSGVFSDINCDTKHDIKLESNSVSGVISDLDCDLGVSVDLDGRTLSTERNPLTTESPSAKESQTPLVCGLCDACFQLSSQLMQHMSTHTGQKPHTVIRVQKTTTADMACIDVQTSTDTPGDSNKVWPSNDQIPPEEPIKVRANTKVQDWLEMCPDDISVVSTVKKVTESVRGAASSICFPALTLKQVVKEIEGEQSDEEQQSSGSEYVPICHAVTKDGQREVKEIEEEQSDEEQQSSGSDYVPSDADSEDVWDDNTPIQASSAHPHRFVRHAVTKDGQVVLDKQQYCYFCQKPQLKLTRHITSQHNDQKYVAKILAQKSTALSDYKKGFKRLKCLGNFVHNVKSLRDGKNDIVVVKRPTKQREVGDYLPCVHCYGFYVTDELWKHTKNCDLKTCDKDLNVKNVVDESAKLLKGTNVIHQSKLMLASACVSHTDLSMSSEMRALTKAMHVDELTEVVSKDKMLLCLGDTLLLKYGSAKRNDISQRLRQLARLLVQVRHHHKNTTITFYGLLCGQQFDACLRATYDLCGLYITADGKREFRVPSLALRLGHLLKKLALIKQGYCLRHDELNDLKQAETFGTLLQSEWTDKIATNAHNTLKRRKDQTVQILPVTEDLRKLRAYQIKEIAVSIDQLKDSSSYQLWRRLAQLVMGRMIIFNKRRGGEVSKLLLQTYKSRPDWKGQTNEKLLKSLEPMERQLLHRMDLVQVPGKESRKVPMLITDEVKEGIEALNAKRESVGIPASNPFCFASRSECAHLNSWQAMHVISSEAALSQPELITSSRLRKYNATVSQLIDLNRGELEWLSNHMGHNLNIHRDFYRLHDSTIEIAKVSRLLMAIDTGNAANFFGKQLDDINLEVSIDDVDESDSKDLATGELADEVNTNILAPSSTQKCRKARSKKRRQIASGSDDSSTKPGHRSIHLEDLATVDLADEVHTNLLAPSSTQKCRKAQLKKRRRIDSDSDDSSTKPGHRSIHLEDLATVNLADEVHTNVLAPSSTPKCRKAQSKKRRQIDSDSDDSSTKPGHRSIYLEELATVDLADEVHTNSLAQSSTQKCRKARQKKRTIDSESNVSSTKPGYRSIHLEEDIATEETNIMKPNGKCKKTTAGVQSKISFDSESEGLGNAKPKKVRSHWSRAEIATLNNMFGHMLKKKIYPSGKHIQLAINRNVCLKNRNTLQVRAKLQHLMNTGSS